MLMYSGLTLHTAASGPVSGLDTLHLELDDGLNRAVGEVRINCAYLNGYEPGCLLDQARQGLLSFDWDASPEELRAGIQVSGLPPPVCMLFDVALWDLSAKRAGVPLAHLLGGRMRPITHATNQTLFLSSEAAFDERLAGYVMRGFNDLKLRVGHDIKADCERHARARRLYGNRIKLAADANGAWSRADAPARLAALVPFQLSYVEQPIAAGDWEAMIELAAIAPMPVMLDESLTTVDDVEEFVRRSRGLQGRLQAHLKLIKLGGLTPALAAAQLLGDAGVPFMIGQMNESAVATAAALHLAVAVQPLHAELYGADGLIDDPAEGLTYANGHVAAPDAAGLGLNFRAPSAPIFSGE